MIEILNGLVYGSFLYLLAVGLVMIFGLRGVINFAHGSFFMLAGYISYSITQWLGFVPSIIVSVIVLMFLGVLLDRLVFQFLSDREPIISLLVTFGLVFILEDVTRIIWGSNALSPLPPDYLSGNILILGYPFPIYRIAVLLVALSCAVFLTWWLRFTEIGLYTRASSVDPVTTGMQGINTDKLSMIVVALGTGFAGVGGALSGPMLSLSPTMGGSIIIDGFIVVITGGLGSFAGAFVVAMLIGIFKTLSIMYVPTFTSVTPLMVMATILIVRPSGLATKR